MSRKPNYRRGGGGSGRSGGYRRFGGTGSFGNYNSGSNYNDALSENRRSGNWTDGNFNRSYDNSVNQGSNNNFGSSNNIPPLTTQEDDRFQKFRDPHSQETSRNNSRSEKRSHQGSGRNSHNRRGGKQRFGNERKKDGGNWYEDRTVNSTVSNEQNQSEYPPTKASLAPNANLLLAATNTPPGTSSPNVPPPIQNELPKGTQIEDRKEIKNIKQEKFEQKEIKRNANPPPPSSSSSSDSSDSEDGTPNKSVQDVVKSNPLKVKQETPGKPTKKIARPPSSSSSSSSEEDETSKEALKETKVPSKPALEKQMKVAKKQPKKKQSSEEDLICLGKLEKKFVIEDDASEEVDEPMQCKSSSTKNQCLICDKQGHTAFECQMICKNCSAPYHNMKSCPKPVNLSIMMQSFMEFCMGQMSQFNPEQKFIFPTNTNVSKNSLVKENLKMENEAQSKKIKKVRGKSKEPRKKLAKRIRRRATKSSDEEEDDDEEEEEEGKDESEEQTSESDSESDSSEEVAAPKAKKKRTKPPALVDSADFRNSFVPPFSSFPAFGAAAAAYNPLLLGQLMHSGSFGTPKKLNF